MADEKHPKSTGPAAPQARPQPQPRPAQRPQMPAGVKLSTPVTLSTPDRTATAYRVAHASYNAFAGVVTGAIQLIDEAGRPAGMRLVVLRRGEYAEPVDVVGEVLKAARAKNYIN